MDLRQDRIVHLEVRLGNHLPVCQMVWQGGNRSLMEKVCGRQKKSITEVLWVGVSFRDFRANGGHSYLPQVLGDLGVMD